MLHPTQAAQRSEPTNYCHSPESWAEWVMRMAEHKKTGVYNATGPAERLTFEQFLETCRYVKTKVRNPP